MAEQDIIVIGAGVAGLSAGYFLSENASVTVLHGVPTMFLAELDHPDRPGRDLSSLRTGIMAGAPCPIEVMKQVQTRMNMGDVTIAYGMTETSPVSFQSNVDDPIEKRVSTAKAGRAATTSTAATQGSSWSNSPP